MGSYKILSWQGQFHVELEAYFFCLIPCLEYIVKRERFSREQAVGDPVGQGFGFLLLSAL